MFSVEVANIFCVCNSYDFYCWIDILLFHTIVLHYLFDNYFFAIHDIHSLCRLRYTLTR